jgi:hypothetical protein
VWKIHGYFSSQRISVVDEMGEMQTMLHSLGASYERRRAEPAQLRRQPASIRGGRDCRQPRVRLLQPTRRCRVCAPMIDEGEAVIVRRIFTLSLVEGRSEPACP